MSGATIALIGTGDLGGWILEFLTRSKGIRKISVYDVNETWGRSKSYGAEVGAYYFGYYPEVNFQKLDLLDIARTAQTLAELNPDVVVQCASMLPWWIREALPPDVYKRVFPSGPWIPGHLYLARNVMIAIRQANIQTQVVQCGFPDGVNAALGKVGLTPTVGGGNSDLIIPGLRKSIGEEIGVPSHNICTHLIAHHFHVMSLIRDQSMGGAPYFIKIMLGDRDITNEINLEKALVDAVKLFPSGTDWHPVVASSFVKNILAIANDTREITHAAGPNGLPGGWPVRLSAKGAEVVLPHGLDMKQAMAIVEGAQKFDGIECIKDDGTIVLTEDVYTAMKDTFGYDCQEFSVEESQERAEELVTRLKKYKDAL